MPLSPSDAAIISSGSTLLGTGVSAIAQAGANKQERKWQEKMYGQQRVDALSDWNMQNLYNSPSSQMSRYKAAGLNPNLIYGTGTSSAGNSSTVRSSTTGSYHPRPLVSGGDISGAVNNALSMYFDMSVKQAQVENLHANNELIHSNTAKNEALISQIGTNIPYLQSKTGLINQMYGYRGEANPLALEQAKVNINKGLVMTDAIASANERAQAMLAPNLKIAAQKVINMRMDVLRNSIENEVDIQKIANMKAQLQFLSVQAAKLGAETSLISSEVDYRKTGGTYHDTWLGRLITSLRNTSGDVGDLLKPYNPPDELKFSHDDSLRLKSIFKPYSH